MKAQVPNIQVALSVQSKYEDLTPYTPRRLAYDLSKNRPGLTSQTWSEQAETALRCSHVHNKPVHIQRSSQWCFSLAISFYNEPFNTEYIHTPELLHYFGSNCLKA